MPESDEWEPVNWDISYTDGGLTFLGVWRQEIDENGNLGEVKEDH